MNVPSVRFFLEVTEAGSLSKVAARRQTVQSHISRQIKFEDDGTARTGDQGNRADRSESVGVEHNQKSSKVVSAESC